MDLVTFIDVIQKVGFTGLLIILAFPVLRRKFFNGVGEYDKLKAEIREIRDNHLKHLQDDVSHLKEDVSFIKGRLEK